MMRGASPTHTPSRVVGLVADTTAALSIALVMTDIATGWTECAALLVREQSLIIEGFAQTQTLLPFAIRSNATAG